MNFSLLPFTLQPQGLYKPTQLLCSQKEASLCDLFVGKLGRGRGQGRLCIYNHHFQDTICISNRPKKKKIVQLLSPTQLCYKLSEDLGTPVGPEIPIDKEKKKTGAGMWKWGTLGGRGLGKSQNKKRTNPVGIFPVQAQK